MLTIILISGILSIAGIILILEELSYRNVIKNSGGVKESKLSEVLQSEQVYGQRALYSVPGLKYTYNLPDYYAEESGLYYNPATNKLKLAGPKTRLTSLHKLGYTEFIGEL